MLDAVDCYLLEGSILIRQHLYKCFKGRRDVGLRNYVMFSFSWKE